MVVFPMENACWVDAYSLSKLFLGDIEYDGNAPDVAAGKGHLPGHRFQVPVAHESLQRGEKAVGEVYGFPGQLVSDLKIRQALD